MLVALVRIAGFLKIASIPFLILQPLTFLLNLNLITINYFLSGECRPLRSSIRDTMEGLEGQ